MLTRSVLALLLLVNYLLVVGLDCVSRPEDQPERLLVQTEVAGQTYHECRYMRMDGLEAFLNEALASRYQTSSDAPLHHLISIVYAVDAHCLPSLTWLVLPPVIRANAPTFDACQPAICAGVSQMIVPPPQLG